MEPHSPAPETDFGECKSTYVNSSSFLSASAEARNLAAVSIRSVGVTGSRKGVQTSIYQSPPAYTRTRVVFGKKWSRTSTYYRNRLYVSKGRNRTRRRCQIAGFLHYNFSGSQEKWKIASGHKPKALKSVPSHTEVQDANVSHVAEGTHQVRVCGVNRPVGCVLSHSHSTSIPEIPQVCVQGSNMAIPGASVRARNLAVRVHSGGQSTVKNSATVRHPTSPIPRRLVDGCNDSHADLGTVTNSPALNTCVGVAGQSREVGTRADSGFRFHRGDIQDVIELDSSSDVSILEISSDDSGDDGPGMVDSSSMARIARSPSVDGGSGRLREATDPSHVSGIETASVIFRSSDHSDSSYSSVVESSLLVAGPGPCHERGPHGDISSPSCRDNGFIDLCVGSPFDSDEQTGFHQRREGGVVSRGGSDAYQCQGTASGSHGSEGVAAGTEREACQGRVGQQNDGVTDKQSGDGEVSGPSLLDSRPVDLVLPVQHCSEGSLSPGVTQCPGGSSVSSEQCSDNRMGVEREGLPGSVSQMGATGHRSVCYQSKLQITDLREPDEGSTGICRGRVVSRLEGNVRLRIPSTKDVDNSPSKSSGHDKIPDDSGRALLAQDALVSRSTKRSNRRSRSSRSTRKSSSHTSSGKRTRSGSPEPIPASASRLDLVQSALRKEGFSEAVSARVANSKKSSTLEIYESRWKHFVHWCTEKDVNPLNCSATEIADFFEYLFEEKGKAPGTIEGYKSALVATLKMFGKDVISNSPAIANLMAAYKAKPKRPPTVPLRWSLSLVLDVLRKPPFEPLSSVSMAHLTLKTVFLVTLASGVRRSEIHAIIYDGSAVSYDKASFILRLDPTFLAKTERTCAVKERTIVIPCLPREDAGEQLLCPVRALRLYVSRTKELRQCTGTAKMFVSYKPGFKGDIGVQSITRWIKKTVQWAYEIAHTDKDVLQLHQIRAHEVRALSASLALLANVSTENILRAASWKSQNTFTSFYLRDLSAEADGLMALGPLVASRKVCKL